ncbi:toll/interleukin-1 receptor domain-containing protein [Variovorax sp. J22R115]|uniref:toll/interleukin-1 receptor domain-containing protein n=1 Tax=Variovorax sp. J22R115 TaxID=3053509 RepID=UPI002574EBAF|nr:toll/interleukin-1 receptor domain-containing protein [Variovorax sp. J22R115]MDM0053512.1 toll/interleukin-1 receptor domain-containing protein [Variovorax sp. J22R115]
MTNPNPNTTNTFISYAHEDAIIAEEIERQFKELAGKGKGRALLAAFLDTKSIPPGFKFKPIIDAALKQTDWLIAVFTDHQSVYVGYEIGIYSFENPHDGIPLDKKPVICLHDIDQNKLPGVVEGYNTTLVTPIETYDAKNPFPAGEDFQVWYESPVGIFLQTVCNSKNLYTANDNPAEYASDIAKAAKEICYAFTLARREEPLWEAPVQAGLEITIYPPANEEFKRIPENSVLMGSSRAFDILGLRLPLSIAGGQPPRVSWGELKEKLLRPHRANIPWMDKLEINVALAAALLSPEPDDVTLKGSDDKIYRAILTRHKLFKNGMRRFYVFLVETFDRRFVGDQQSSMLLIALTLASRWRFTFFEKWHETLMKFDPARSEKEFRDACTQLEHNMEWMEHEGVELGADNEDAMVAAFGLENKARVQRFYSDYYKVKNKLDGELPETFEDLKPEAREKIRAAIVEFLTSIKEDNAEFLKLCIEKYAEKMRE